MSKKAPGPERLGAFSDGVIAIIITIMVLELHIPRAPTFVALAALWPTFLSYALSYVLVGIVWVNHHHLVHYTERATPGVLWTNLLLLFFVSPIPFFAEWMAASKLSRLATAMYAVDLVMTSLTFNFFEHHVAVQIDREDARLVAARAAAKRRNWLAFALYACAIPAACFHPWVGIALIVFNALLFLVPEARVRGDVVQQER